MGVPCYSREVKKTPEGGSLVVKKKENRVAQSRSRRVK